MGTPASTINVSELGTPFLSQSEREYRNPCKSAAERPSAKKKALADERQEEIGFRLCSRFWFRFRFRLRFSPLRNHRLLDGLAQLGDIDLVPLGCCQQALRLTGVLHLAEQDNLDQEFRQTGFVQLP